jgi:hypothetical protein
MGVVVGKQKFQKTTTTAEIALPAELMLRRFSVATVYTVQPIMYTLSVAKRNKTHQKDARFTTVEDAQIFRKRK